MSLDLSRFHATFMAESFAGLDAMEADLLKLERGERSAETMHAIFRVVHSLKGAAGTLGFDRIADFSHHLESLLDGLRNDRLSVDSGTVSVLLQSVDVLRGLLGVAQDGSAADEAAVDSVRARVIELGKGGGGPSQPVALQARSDSTQQRYSIRFRPNARFFQSGDDPLRLLRELSTLGECRVQADIGSLPELEELDPELSYLAWRIELTGPASRSEVEEVFAWVDGDSEVHIQTLDTIDPWGGEASPAPAESVKPWGRRAADHIQEDARGAESAAMARASTLQVSTEKVDALVNLVGELVITQTMLKQCGEEFSMDRLEQLRTALASLERNTRDLQQSVLAIRMLPVSFLFGRFHRLVRDVAMALGKKAELKISGESSELDKTVIEKLFDPLTHLLRNALDHGIETPQQRLAAGKVEIGTIHLHAEHRAGSIEIEVRDDGRGIDHARVRAKALHAGLIDAGEEMSQERVLELLFAPGFSTAEQISDVSGRGVGLDVVRQNIASLGGAVEVSSALGKGTSFRIRLPLTLAIVEGMFVQAGEHTYVLPLAFIIECMQAGEGAVKPISGRGLVVEVRGEYIPIVDLASVLGLRHPTSLDNGVLVLLEAEQRKVALVVDSIVGQDQVVIKSLEANYQKVAYVAGATILGNGRVALILDANALARASDARRPVASGSAARALTT